MTVTGKTSNAARASFTKKTCKAAKTYGTHLLSLVTTPSQTTINQVASESVDAYCLFIAVALEEEDLIVHYLRQNASVWRRTRVFPEPIAIVAQHNTVEIVSSLLKQVEECPGTATNAVQLEMLDRGVWIAIRHRRWETAITMINWWIRCFGRPHFRKFISWITEAVSNQVADFAAQLFDQSATSETKVFYRLTLFCSWNMSKSKRALLLDALIDRDILDFTKVYMPAASLLTTAVTGTTSISSFYASRRARILMALSTR
ncbi:hypothetical protein BDW02DRAFT_621054 [Decorospora gaudefroyi]|uniref:Uncharacterized protein n=1 Tax=Decorospora gaudefroyi TaxID=184978 RepID=A0A6A5KF07_9PLEO|nr:hypothetical protein BDW02DRAFT_621054 [Decorospora gaudefroyi]